MPCPLFWQHIPGWYEQIFRDRGTPRFSRTAKGHTDRWPSNRWLRVILHLQTQRSVYTLHYPLRMLSRFCAFPFKISDYVWQENVHKTKGSFRIKRNDTDIIQSWINGKITYLRPLVIVGVRGGRTGEGDGVGFHSYAGNLSSPGA